MPLPLTLQRSYLKRNEAVQDQAAGISRQVVTRGEPVSQSGGPAPVAPPVQVSDERPTDTVSSDIYTGGAATKLKTTGGDYNFQDSISRRLGTLNDIGVEATGFNNERIFQQRAKQYQDQANSANLGYSFNGATGGAGGSDRRSAIIRAAEKYLGTPYKWGGESPKSGFDCSGLIQYVYGQYGFNTPRVSQQQARMGTVTRDLNRLKPGDFIAWDRGGTGGASHIAIYAGNGRIIESPHSGATVRYRAINMREPGIYGVALGGL